MRRLIGPLLASVVVAAVLTSPALVHIAAHGTLSDPVQMVHWLRHPTGTVVPASQARKAVLGDLSIHGTWLSGEQSVDCGGPSTTTRFPAFLLLGLATTPPPSAGPAVPLPRPPRNRHPPQTWRPKFAS